MSDTSLAAGHYPDKAAEKTALAILVAISFCHLTNDTMQSLLLSIYPMLKESYALDFGQVGLITLTFQVTASLLQPMIGLYTDRRPRPFALAGGMASTLLGLLLLSYASSYPMLLLAAALIGTGSSVFHPEASRVARLASGGRHGLAQSLFQVGGNLGSAIGPLAAAYIVLPRGQSAIAWFSLVALIAILVLVRVGAWYRAHLVAHTRQGQRRIQFNQLTRREVGVALAVLLGLIFSKFFYTASLSSYYTFYMIEHFGVSMQRAQIYLFIYLAAFSLGTLVGGPIGDKIGRKKVIWFSILGSLPFTLILPYANEFWVVVLTVPIGLILSSAFSAIVVYAQELMPGRVGMVAGLFFGLAFGMGGIGAAVLGELADVTSIELVFQLCAFLPVIGLVTWLLPNLESSSKRSAA
ncbi:MFS transporter [Dongia deserti]|uniref:MFS transporter n=1 Tax=Dongia deserti TaxID=2268030 RepID=UPI000E65E4B5|nr:MFS transporter [Dongia deserti]